MGSILTAPPSDLKLEKTVKGLMLGRVVILTLLLGIAHLFQIYEKKYFFIPMTSPFYYFIGLFYFVTVVYALLLKRLKDLRKFTVVQLSLDHLFIAGLVLFTGGNESYFPMAYFFTILGSSILFYKKGAFYSASFATLLYGLTLLSQYYGWIRLPHQAGPPEASQVFYPLITYLSAFYIIAFLSSLVAEELKKKRKELIQKQVDYEQLETFNRNIVQSLDSGLLTIDLEGRINFLNRTAEKILNRKIDELRNLRIGDLFPEIAKVLKTLKTYPNPLSDYQRYEILLKEQNGRKVYLGFSISPLTDPEGGVIGHTLIFQDITRYKEMEEQMKRCDRMAAIGALAAGMAHEIRNPLASLSGAIQMLKSELCLDAHKERLMEITLRETERLNALINDFLLFAHPPQIEPSPWRIGQILDETVELFKHSPHCHPGIHVTRNNGDGEEIEAMVDPGQIRQVFWNLLINAAQAIPEEGTIGIGLEKVEEGGGEGPALSGWGKKASWVKVTITDTGIGIPPEEKEKIFDPFYTTKEGGTGLGLSIVHKIIENHRGMIRVASEPGRGAAFTLYLPAGPEIHPTVNEEKGENAEREDLSGR